jgi:UDP-N-acetylglucosamine 2-epimerase (non-hydrolysing)
MKKLVDGVWKKGEIPDLWDGKTAQRIIAILSEMSAA